MINPVGSGEGEDKSIHQVNPAWVLTFVRWEHRDTLRTGKKQIKDGATKVKTIDYSTVRNPLVVENDCIQVSVSSNKGVLTPNMTATLVMTDVNYETALAPGDFVFVNMLNWEQDARRVGDQARQNKPINGAKDGFKGIFKIQGIRKILTTDPNTGTKILLFRITGFAFTEFNNTIYFNPYMLSNAETNNLLLFSSYIGTDWQLLAKSEAFTNVQDLLKALIESFIGTGISDAGRSDSTGAIKSPNTHFFMPKMVGNLLGVNSAKAAKDIYNYLFGIQQYSAGSSQSLASGLNPSGLTVVNSRFYYTNTKCQGDTVHKPEYWNQVKTWSILNQFTNAPLNELYTCFRLSPNGRVMPTVVFRQIPFTTDAFNAAGASVTRFMNIPRWKINPALIMNMDIGRDESARVNFVQYFAKCSINLNGWDISSEVANRNYLYDIDDVQRSGLRPYIVTTQFDDPPNNSNVQGNLFRSPFWAKIVGDALIGGHLKMNGTMECAGLVDPIAVGDNLEFDGVVYHIEEVSHSANISPAEGKRVFRTTIRVSQGVSKDSDASALKYAEMTYADAYQLRDVDYKNNQILPGVSESQAVVYRDKDPTGTPQLDTPHGGGAGFPQPNKGTSLNKSTRDEKDKK